MDSRCSHVDHSVCIWLVGQNGEKHEHLLAFLIPVGYTLQELLSLQTDLRTPPTVIAHGMTFSSPLVAESGLFLRLSRWFSRNITVLYEYLMQRLGFGIINLCPTTALSLRSGQE